MVGCWMGGETYRAAIADKRLQLVGPWTLTRDMQHRIAGSFSPVVHRRAKSGTGLETGISGTCFLLVDRLVNAPTDAGLNLQLRSGDYCGGIATHGSWQISPQGG